MKKVKIKRSHYGTIVFNEEIFSEIENYIVTNYDKCHAEIKRNDGSIDDYDSLSDVHTQIDQHPESILKIEITAHKDDNIFTIHFNNKPKIGEGTLVVNAEINKSMKEVLKKFLAAIDKPTGSINLRVKTSYDFLLHIGIGMLIMSVFKNFQGDTKYIALGVFFVLVLIVTMLVGVMTIKVIPVLKARRQDEVLIRFWTKAQLIQAQVKADEDAMQIKFRKRVIGAVLFVISVVIIAVT